ncbi:hypothetical protein M9H77_36994 [Catharanthus roseus]|uniref:Uncharacterized protein n=1 Tax=Catharanthus roseus TaxID=4058 RepID=A0ACB9ZTE7_CATRO|nr:hypothetical protein M9H77_36994 [Catharanthus roseus]
MAQRLANPSHSVKSLLELSLKCRRLKLPKDVECHNLKSLHLYHVSLDESALERIITSCQKIEDLKLCWFEAPNLEFLSCTNGRSLSNPHNLKQLVLVESDKIPDGFFSDFPNLEDLEIYDDWFKLRRFRISSNSFREIKLNAINRWNNLDELHIDSPECEEIISNKLMMATRDEEDQWRLKEVNLLKDKGECTFEQLSDKLHEKIYSNKLAINFYTSSGQAFTELVWYNIRPNNVKEPFLAARSHE